MKVLKMKNLLQRPDRENIVTQCLNTVDGLECAHINMNTGEITYGNDACIDEALLRETFAKQGIELEDAQ